MITKNIILPNKEQIQEKMFKIGSWVGFGPIWTADSNSMRKTVWGEGFRSVFVINS